MTRATRTIGRFEIVRRIGRGGMAVVYLARQVGLDREVALKELVSFDAEHDPALAERFLYEARMAGSLAHPNIVTVFDYFEQDGTPYIAMEYITRGSLRPLIGRLSLAQAARVLEGVLAGLEHAGARGIVHRDVKPENLLVTDDGAVKIADLGIAKAYNRVSMGLTSTGMAIGTPAYMAPEQATGAEVSPRTDLYATGVIAYELLLGQVPFPQTDAPLAVLWKHVNAPVPSALALKPDLDPRIAAWLDRMLAKSPDERPSSAREAFEELEETVVDLLGWRWRQHARLPDETQAGRPPVAPESPVFRSALHPAPAPVEPTTSGVASGSDPASAPTAPASRPATAELPGHTGVSIVDTAALEELARGRRSEWRRVGAASALAAALALAVAAGVALGRADGGVRTIDSRLTPVERGGLVLHVPPSWRRAPGSVIPDLPMSTALAVAPSRAQQVRLVGGRVKATAPSFLSAGFVARLDSGFVSRRERVALSNLEAYRYRQLRPRGASFVATLFVVPVSADTAVTLACIVDRSASDASSRLASCERVAATAELEDATTVRLVASPGYARRVRAALARLDRTRQRELRRLRNARSRASQAQAAEALARACREASASLRRAPLSIVTRIPTLAAARRLDGTATAFAQLAAAVRRGSPGAYRAASRAVRRHDRALGTALAALGGLPAPQSG